MDQTLSYIDILRKTVQEAVANQPRLQAIKLYPVCDIESGHFLVLATGWDNQRWMDTILFHARLVEQQIIIEEDNFEESLTQALIAKGVKKEDIKTSSYNVEPMYQYYNCNSRDGGVCPPPQIVGYTVRQSVEVKLRDFALIGELLSGVVQNGANSVSQMRFTIDDIEEVRQEARIKAVAKAQEKAKNLAKAAGFTLGKILSIDEGFDGGRPYAYAESYDAVKTLGAPSPTPSPTIEPGSQDVTATVNILYEIR